MESQSESLNELKMNGNSQSKSWFILENPMSQGLVMVHYNESFHYSRLTDCSWQWQMTSDSDNWQWEWSKWLNDDTNDHK